MTYREAYETWLKEFTDDQATVDELKAIAGRNNTGIVYIDNKKGAQQ